MTPQLGPQHSYEHKLRWLFLTIVTASFVFLVPWIAYLATNLPSRYEVRQWNVAWVGFDCMLVAAVGLTALFAWLRRQVFIPWAIATGTLLTCDAWFDIVMDWNTPDLPSSLFTALFGELPLAALLFYAARRLIKLALHAAWVLTGHTEPAPGLGQFRMIGLSTWWRVEQQFEHDTDSIPNR
ncbi:hypothetical protein [Nocardia pseudovaccinii]|uniref:hypothetical protein n=1 Tax=Nocardia pseudovaccinii TaxID=189540 RepID=UPI0007A55870|nr:hypothetical protein [Nocardia pseudovaccinii]